jgi:HTH-type transcriptional regulator, sugar sensing transcriptional regulator
MDLPTMLEQIGLSERESRVYLALLDIGPSTTSKLIRKTGIASSKIYDVLEKLENKGVATHILVRGKKQFQAANPQKLFDLVKEKEALVKEMIPMLQSLYEETREEIQAEVYKGKEGIKEIFEDILRTGQDWYAIGASGKAAFTLPYYMPHFYQRMKKKKIQLNILFVDAEETRKQAQELKTYSNIKTKFLPSIIKNLMVIFVYDNKLAIIPITPTVEIMPLAILIKSKESAEGYKDYFKWLWNLC